MIWYDNLKAELGAALIDRWRKQFNIPQGADDMGSVIVNFSTQQDLYVGERFMGYTESSVHADRVFGRLVEIVVVCVDDLHPGWLNVKARASGVRTENTKGAGSHDE